VKICIVAAALTGGGLERVVSVLANNLAENHDLQVSIVLMTKQPIMYDISSKIKLIEPNEKKYSKLNRIFNSIYTSFFIRKEIKNLNPDHIISFGERYNSFVVFSCLFLGIKLHVSNRASPLSSLVGFRGFFNPIFYRFCKTVHVQTQLAIKLMAKKYKGSNLVVVPNPFDLPEILPNFEDRKNIILNVGSIGGKKNQDLLLTFFNQIKDSIDNSWELHFVGDGPKAKQLQEKVNELGLQNRVKLLGHRKDVLSLYKTAKVFAFTSTSEGFPNALGEAMAYGLAAISFDCITGPAELIDDKINGILMPVEEHEYYVNQLQVLLNDAALQKQFSEAAIQKMKNFEISNVTQKFLQTLVS
jgi:GalNAc-alpha-(1->4)-GalNAc-alpha-(1->3)-diNAcBac-PP-undecaprenol alpha-1,4-N-acetyl-D-galactosaminyltransferase